MRLDWAEGAGDVVWSNDRQEGYLRLASLEANDPGQVQYQLWIFDGRRHVFNAVDGGVFDVAPGGELVVPIDPKLAVFEPVLFAITSEPPGGVVVSDRSRIATLALPQG